MRSSKEILSTILEIESTISLKVVPTISDSTMTCLLAIFYFLSVLAKSLSVPSSSKRSDIIRYMNDYILLGEQNKNFYVKKHPEVCTSRDGMYYLWRFDMLFAIKVFEEALSFWKRHYKIYTLVLSSAFLPNFSLSTL